MCPTCGTALPREHPLVRAFWFVLGVAVIGFFLWMVGVQVYYGYKNNWPW
jgi:hypothetical protein